MKLSNNGWGYRTFIMCMCMIFTFVIVANHYIHLLMGVIDK